MKLALKIKNKIQMKKVLTLAFSIALFSACNTGGNTQQNEAEASETPNLQNECSYSFDSENTKLNWTAYKFTEKVGVSGTFNTFTINQTNEADAIASVFSNAEFEIATESVNSNDEGRDYKIKQYFFGSLASGEVLKGKLLSLNNDGTASIVLRMNEVEKEIDAQYTIEENTITLSAVLDVENFNAAIGISALNAVCDELHKGSDGISKLWPEVKIQIVSTLKKNCP